MTARPLAAPPDACPWGNVTLTRQASASLEITYADPGRLSLVRRSGGRLLLTASETRELLKLLKLVEPHLEGAK